MNSKIFKAVAAVLLSFVLVIGMLPGMSSYRVQADDGDPVSAPTAQEIFEAIQDLIRADLTPGVPSLPIYCEPSDFSGNPSQAKTKVTEVTAVGIAFYCMIHAMEANLAFEQTYGAADYELTIYAADDVSRSAPLSNITAPGIYNCYVTITTVNDEYSGILFKAYVEPEIKLVPEVVGDTDPVFIEYVDDTYYQITTGVGAKISLYFENQTFGGVSAQQYIFNGFEFDHGPDCGTIVTAEESNVHYTAVITSKLTNRQYRLNMAVAGDNIPPELDGSFTAASSSVSASFATTDVREIKAFAYRMADVDGQIELLGPSDDDISEQRSTKLEADKDFVTPAGQYSNSSVTEGQTVSVSIYGLAPQTAYCVTVFAYDAFDNCTFGYYELTTSAAPKKSEVVVKHYDNPFTDNKSGSDGKPGDESSEPESEIPEPPEPKTPEPPDNSTNNMSDVDKQLAKRMEKLIVELCKEKIGGVTAAIVTKVNINSTVQLQKKKDGKFLDSDGAPVPDKFVSYKNKIYFTDADGKAQKDTLVFSGEDTFYFGDKGALVQDEVIIFQSGEKMYACEDGRIAKKDFYQTGDGMICYSDRDGFIKTGEFKYAGKKFYADETGSVVLNQGVLVNGTEYYAGSDGVLRVLLPDGTVSNKANLDGKHVIDGKGSAQAESTNKGTNTMLNGTIGSRLDSHLNGSQNGHYTSG